jgi:D-alanyl-D-alanine carboxypeptidase-like protein
VAVTLREKQSLFAELVAVLLVEAGRLGFAVTFGEAYRSPEEAARLAKLGKGIKASLHCQRLAIDLNLFRDGKYLTSSEAHRPLGEAWQALHPACRWGGTFKRADGNHYELNPKAF